MNTPRLGSVLLDFVYPPKCGLCGRIGHPAICDVCRSELVLDGVLAQPDGPLDGSVGIFVYEGRAAQSVQRLKFERVTSLARPMASLMGSFASESFAPFFDAVIPVPIHISRRRIRGFNQAEILATGFESEMVRKDCLLRIKATRPQVGLTVMERTTNLVGAFRAMGSLAGTSVLLVDDVTTSGATAKECALELKRVGADRVYLLAFARG